MKLVADSTTVLYDGEEHTVTTYKVYRLDGTELPGVTFNGVTVTGSGTDAGSYTATVSGVTLRMTRDTTNATTRAVLNVEQYSIFSKKIP